MEDKLLEIIKHYGVMHQLKYFQSEVFELNEAIIKAEVYESKKGDTFSKVICNISAHVEHIAEEIADVQVMLDQFKQYYRIDDDEILDRMQQKIDRQLERIKNE